MHNVRQMTQASRSVFEALKKRIIPTLADRCASRDVDIFLLRLECYFEDLYLPLVELYGERSDAHHQFEALIAATAVRHIEWSKVIPADTIVVTVSKGRITLDGEVEWQYQKDAAINVVMYLSGVTGVTNLISVKPTLTAVAVEPPD